jgi:long-chain acyl-CoA synthetase
VGHVVVHGERRPFVSALIAPDPETIRSWAKRRGIAAASYGELACSPEVRELLAQGVEELNSRLPRWQTIKRFAVLDHPLSVDAGELTPSLKVRRRVVEERYRDQLDALYREPAGAGR